MHCFASSCMAKDIFFVGKSVLLYLLERPELRMHYEEDREEKKKVLHPAGFEPTTSLFRGVLSSSGLQLLPNNIQLIGLQLSHSGRAHTS